MLFVSVEKPIFVFDPDMPIVDVTGIRPPIRDTLGWVVQIVSEQPGIGGCPPLILPVAAYRLQTSELMRAALTALKPLRSMPPWFSAKGH